MQGEYAGVYDFLIPDCFCIQDIKEKRDEDLLVLPTDAVLFEDPSFKVKQLQLYFHGYYNST